MRAYFYKAVVMFCLALIAPGLYVLREIYARPALDPTARTINSWTPSIDGAGTLPDMADSADASVLILAKPIFAPSRKPFVPAPPATEIVAPASPEPLPETPLMPDATSLVLKGILLTDQVRKALIANPENPSGNWFEAGQKVAGWTVADFKENGVVLTQGAQSIIIKLYVDNSQLPLGAAQPAQ